MGIFLSEKYNNQRMKGTVMFVIGAFLHLWIKPVKTHQAVYVEGLQAALASGEKLFAGFLLGQSLIGIAEEGRTLKEMMEKYEEYEKIAIKTQNSSGLDYLVPHSLYYAYLNFADAKERLLSHENKNEKYYFDKLSKSNPTVYTVSLLYKIQSSFVLEKWTETQEILSILENYLPTLGGTVVQIAWLCLEPIFDNFLIVKGLAKEEELAKRLEASMPKLRQMATLNPENFARYVDMLDGILAWKNENYIEAMQKIESAVEKSKQSGNLFDIGIFSELASHFYKKINHKKLEESYIQDAYFAYKRWGAKLKVEQLEQEYPFLLVKTVIGQTKMATTRHTMFESKHSSTGSSNELDIISLSKATQSIMGEVVLEKLLSKLIKIVIENAGAQRGILLLPKNDELVVEAQINGEQIELLTSVSLAECSEKNILPVKVINYVQRTQKSLLLANASDNTELLNKRYIDSQKTKSLLAMPLLNQGKLAAVLYLENNLLTGAFTEERLLILNILSTQIAIAIDNALLYANLEQKVEQRTAELNKTNGNLQVMIRQVEKQREIITEKNENITASINYARNIQRAMLPFQTKIESAFGENNFFVMYMPRDIVSGDFYFFEQILTSQHQRLSFFAVADCTGHGIPGAFMSMIGNQILHEIIIKNKVYEANRILESLHKGVRQALRQEQTDNNDGMDILITVLHQNTDSNVFEEIDYSGAMNPFYYVTFPVDAPAEFKEIKATKRAIGGKQKEEERLFENHKIVLNETTILYLSTDGFQDQFGGAENRKFLTKRFRELLFSVSNLPLNEQKDILENTINSWIGSYHQTDDITIVGLKLN
ncbi:MAG: GAF domain-containing protein [Bacteroidetes bacterium]|nr:MAG: GAF domain-containing protein [Bacteroidota bacterium]